MNGNLFIEKIQIGIVNLNIIDEYMGVLSGIFTQNENYIFFKSKIQQCYERNGIANCEDFNFKIIITENNVISEFHEGIGLTDSKDYDEVILEICGVDLSIFK